MNKTNAEIAKINSAVLVMALFAALTVSTTTQMTASLWDIFGSSTTSATTHASAPSTVSTPLLCSWGLTWFCPKAPALEVSPTPPTPTDMPLAPPIPAVAIPKTLPPVDSTNTMPPPMSTTTTQAQPAWYNSAMNAVPSFPTAKTDTVTPTMSTVCDPNNPIKLKWVDCSYVAPALTNAGNLPPGLVEVHNNASSAASIDPNDFMHFMEQWKSAHGGSESSFASVASTSSSSSSTSMPVWGGSASSYSSYSSVPQVWGWSTVSSSSEMHVHFAASDSCNDEVDNDNDGRIDSADPGCVPENGHGHPTEIRDEYEHTAQVLHKSIPASCADGIDNNGDGKIDADDPSCWTFGATGEMSSVSSVHNTY